MFYKYVIFLIVAAGLLFYILTPPVLSFTFQIDKAQPPAPEMGQPVVFGEPEENMSAESILYHTNDARRQNNLPVFKADYLLQQAARKRAEDMAARGYFSHQTPEGKMFWDFIGEAAYNYKAVGENLAVDYNNPADLISAWMNSPAHRKNILNGNFTRIGIGTAEGLYSGKKTIFIVELYAAPDESGLFASRIIH